MPRYSVGNSLSALGPPVIPAYPNIRYVRQGPLFVPDRTLQGIGSLSGDSAALRNVLAEVRAGKAAARGILQKQLGPANAALAQYRDNYQAWIEEIDRSNGTAWSGLGSLGIGSTERILLAFAGGMAGGLYLAGNGSSVLNGAKGLFRGTWKFAQKGFNVAKDGVARAVGWVTTLAQGGNKDGDGKSAGLSVSVKDLSSFFQQANGPAERRDERGNVVETGGGLDMATRQRYREGGSTGRDVDMMEDEGSGLSTGLLVALGLGGAYLLSQNEG